MESICAGIVLYNPAINLLEENISEIINQVDELYLYDNCSSNLNEIKNLVAEFKKVTLECGNENKGIAYGLNKINQYASSKKYKWVLTLDQDSICSDNLIDEYQKYITMDNVAMICPFILNNNKLTFEQYKQLDLPEYEYILNPIDCITSACLCNVEIIQNLGGYNEKFFIDYVDTEINCRVLKSNYCILRANRAYLKQSMGVGKKVPVFSFLYNLTGLDIFRRMKVATVYNDLRLYYEARNSYATYKMHNNAGKRLNPIFMLMLFLYFSLVYPKERSRIKMWKSILRGFKDSKELIK